MVSVNTSKRLDNEIRTRLNEWSTLKNLITNKFFNIYMNIIDTSIISIYDYRMKVEEKDDYQQKL